MSGASSTGPLAGIRIVDLSIALTGPYAAALLADQGAEVIKVERPGLGDIGRWVGVSVNGLSALYQACNRGKRSIAVDAATTAGRDIVRRLVASADVLVENFRPRVMDRLGLGYGAHVPLSMLDAVVSFRWADAAGNDVLLAADRSRPSSFVANFRPFRFREGWGSRRRPPTTTSRGCAARWASRATTTLASRPSPSGTATGSSPARSWTASTPRRPR